VRVSAMGAREDVSEVSRSVCRGSVGIDASGVRSMRYHLPSYVHACRTGGGLVFLDARRDRYFGLGGAHVGRLAERVTGLCGDERAPDGLPSQDDPPGQDGPPSQDDPPSQSVVMDKVEGLAERLIGAGLLGRGSGDVPRRHDKSVPPPEMGSAAPISEDRVRLRPIEVLRFFQACGRAAWALRWRSLESIASRVSAARREGAPYDAARARELVRVFQTLRSWTFSEKNRCLFNALALVYFLRGYGCFPHFVIGVKAAPFAAHSWVQKEGVVLDGDPASVGHFVPILVA